MNWTLDEKSPELGLDLIEREDWFEFIEMIGLCVLTDWTSNILDAFCSSSHIQFAFRP